MSSEVERLRREVQSLTDRLKKCGMDAGTKKAKRRKRGTAGSQVTPGATSTLVEVPSTGRRRRGRRAKRGTMEGEIVISREELVRSLTVKASKTSAIDYFDLLPENFEYLKQISTAFERVQWMSCQLFWKPAVGTTFGGLVTYAVDWDSDLGANVGRAKLSAYTPVVSHAVWQDSQKTPLVLPPSRLMSRTWYLFSHSSADVVDKQPGRIGIAADCSASNSDVLLGEMWVRYSVKFSGTRSS